MEWRRIADDWWVDLREYRGHVFERPDGGYRWNLTEANNLVMEGFDNSPIRRVRANELRAGRLGFSWRRVVMLIDILTYTLPPVVGFAVGRLVRAYRVTSAANETRRNELEANYRTAAKVASTTPIDGLPPWSGHTTKCPACGSVWLHSFLFRATGDDRCMERVCCGTRDASGCGYRWKERMAAES